MRQISVDTSFGATVVSQTGDGPTLLVLHGGPGLNHWHLVPALRELGELRTVSFFDQLGCDPSTTVRTDITVEQTLKHALQVARATARGATRFGIVAHSWGTFLALELVSKAALPVDELILLSPFPLTEAGLRRGFDVLDGRIPQSVLSRLSAIEADNGAGSEIMDLLYPFYAGKAKTAPPSQLWSYRPSVNASVFQSLGSFDITPASRSVPSRTLVLRGTLDFIPRDSVQPLFNHAAAVIELADVGHFPFLEDEARFKTLVKQFLQQTND